MTETQSADDCRDGELYGFLILVFPANAGIHPSTGTLSMLAMDRRFHEDDEGGAGKLPGALQIKRSRLQ